MWSGTDGSSGVSRRARQSLIVWGPYVVRDRRVFRFNPPCSISMLTKYQWQSGKVSMTMLAK
ncbi:hypothetical protein ACS0TY_004942 [Phlomoides rotata]